MTSTKPQSSVICNAIIFQTWTQRFLTFYIIIKMVLINCTHFVYSHKNIETKSLRKFSSCVVPMIRIGVWWFEAQYLFFVFKKLSYWNVLILLKQRFFFHFNIKKCTWHIQTSSGWHFKELFMGGCFFFSYKKFQAWAINFLRTI